jgi:hypothetical protein
VAGVAAALDVLGWLQGQDASTLASSVGWVQVESPSMLALVLGGGVVAGALLYRRRPRGLVERRLAAAVVVPVCGAVAVTGLLLAEIRTTGTVGYYGAKLLVGVFLVVLVLGVTVLAHLLAHVLASVVPAGGPGSRPPRIAALGPVLGLTLGPALGLAAVLVWVPSGGGSQLRDDALRHLHDPQPKVSALIRAVPLQQRRPFGTVLYVSDPSVTGDPNSYGESFADAWFTALTGTASRARFTAVQGAAPGRWGPRQIPSAMASWLRADPRHLVVVEPRGVDIARRWVGDAGLAGRVVTP